MINILIAGAEESRYAGGPLDVSLDPGELRGHPGIHSWVAGLQYVESTELLVTGY